MDKGLVERLRRVNKVGIALSRERDRGVLWRKILLEAKAMVGADAGTLYIMGDDCLEFAIIDTDTLDIHLGLGEVEGMAVIALGGDNNTVAGRCAVEGRTIDIPDIDEAVGYDFSGTRAFDAKNGYRSRSMLAVPLHGHENEVIGVLQLINKVEGGAVVPFSGDDRELVEALSSMAAVSISQHNLADGMNGIFESLIRVIADAIDEKSPHTGKHCRRVPVIATLLAQAVNASREGAYKDCQFSPDKMYELRVASWLHDCGKVTTPVHIVDKGTRLEGIIDGVELVDLRFEILRRENPDADLGDAQDFVRLCNSSGTVVDEAMAERLRELAELRWVDRDGVERALLTKRELENLCICRGTLNEDERKVIQDHASITIDMLGKLPFPDHLKQVPEIAGAHHERVDGKGYPHGLTGDQMSVQARLLAIADVFEALTSCDRPYKKAMPLSQALKILREMSEEGHIDKELFKVFMRYKVYLNYGLQYLSPDQLDLPECSPDMASMADRIRDR